MKKTLVRLFAVVLALCLGLPGSSSALRQEQPESPQSSALLRAALQTGQSGLEEGLTPEQVRNRISAMSNYTHRVAQTWFDATPRPGKMRSFAATMEALFADAQLRARLDPAGLDTFGEIAALYWGANPPSRTLTRQQEYLFLLASPIFATIAVLHDVGASMSDAEVLENVVASSGPGPEGVGMVFFP